MMITRLHYWEGLLCLIFLLTIRPSEVTARDKVRPDTLPYPALFESICDTVALYFYDETFIEQRLPNLKEQYREIIQEIDNPVAFSTLVNDFLTEFKTSHTAYYSPNDEAYYHLASIFFFLPAVKKIFGEQEIQYRSIGILTQRTDRGWAIQRVLNDSPAERSGFQSGDLLISLNDEPYSLQNLQEAGEEVLTFTVERKGKKFELTTFSARVNPQEELEEASRKSARLIQRGDHQLAYVRLWSFAGERYYDLLKELVLYGELKDADALILDLRGGWGGANPEYLNLFNRSVPKMEFQGRNGPSFSYDSQWRKPVVLLVDHSVRSGKEILAFGFRKYGIGQVIGTNTAGAVTGGRIFFLPDQSLLYLAVNMARVDGEILEGKGVAPDIMVADDKATPEDEVLERATTILAGKLKN